MGEFGLNSLITTVVLERLFGKIATDGYAHMHLTVALRLVEGQLTVS